MTFVIAFLLCVLTVYVAGIADAVSQIQALLGGKPKAKSTVAEPAPETFATFVESESPKEKFKRAKSVDELLK